MVTKPEIIAVIIIAVTLFLLVKYTAVTAWHVLVILIAGLVLSAYVPQTPRPDFQRRRMAVLTRHLADPSLTPRGNASRDHEKREKHAHEDH